MQSILEQIGLSTGLERTQNLRIACVCRQHDHFCIRKFVANRNQGVDAAHLRHLQVHKRDVRTVRPELLNGIAPVGCLAHQDHIALNANQTGDPLPHNWMVVNRKNSNLRDASAHELLLYAFALRENHGRLGAVAYTALAGTRSSTSVPASTSLQTTSLPPIRLARSRIPGSP